MLVDIESTLSLHLSASVNKYKAQSACNQSTKTHIIMSFSGFQSYFHFLLCIHVLMMLYNQIKCHYSIKLSQKFSPKSQSMLTLHNGTVI